MPLSVDFQICQLKHRNPNKLKVKMNIEKNCQIKQSVFVPILKYLAIVLKNNQPTDVFIVIVIDTGEDENVVTDGR